MNERPLATPKEVATYLQKSERTLANWRWAGIGPAYLSVEGTIRYRWAELEEWLNAQHTEADRPHAR